MRLVWQLLVLAAISFAGSLVAPEEGSPWLQLIGGLATAALAIVAYRWVVRRTEKRPVAELDGPGSVRSTAAGALLGSGWFVVVIAVLAATGHYTISGLGSVPGAFGFVGLMAAAAVTEELLYRGVLFRILEGWWGTWIALAVTSLLFGVIHLTNPNATLWGAFAIAIEAGALLAAAYAATRSLWLPIGLHFAWNFTAAGIFSAEVSGNGASEGLFEATTRPGAVLLTGGEFGPEGSIITVALGTVLTAVFLWVAARRGNLVPLRRPAASAPAAATLAP